MILGTQWYTWIVLGAFYSINAVLHRHEDSKRVRLDNLKPGIRNTRFNNVMALVHGAACVACYSLSFFGR